MPTALIIIAAIAVMVLLGIVGYHYRHKFGRHGYVFELKLYKCSSCYIGFIVGGHVRCNCGVESPHLHTREKRDRWIKTHRASAARALARH